MTLVIDQATQLRSLVRDHQAQHTPRHVRRRASVIAITSGKGGVGKSNVAVNLAIKLASAGKIQPSSRRRTGAAGASPRSKVKLQGAARVRASRDPSFEQCTSRV